MSVAGLIGSQYLDLLATVEHLGSTVMMQAPLSMGILSHRASKVALFDAEQEKIVLS